MRRPEPSEQSLDGGGQGLQRDVHTADSTIPTDKNHVRQAVSGREEEVVEQSPLGVCYDWECQGMAEPELDSSFRRLFDIDCHDLKTAASVLVPKLLDMRSLRIARASPGSEEIEQKHLAGILG
jgi:hypothetical protein